MKDTHCKKLHIVIESNDTCIDCGSYDFCNEDNCRPYPNTAKDKFQIRSFWISVVLISFALFFLLARVLIDYFN